MTTDYELPNLESLEDIEIPFTYKGEKFLIKEATADDARVYKNFLMSRTSVGPDGTPVGFKDIADIEILLVGRCLYRPDSKEPIGKDVVAKWSNRVIRPIYETIKKISELSADEEDEKKDKAKN